MAELDPSAPAGPESGLFGLGSTPDEARVHVIPVPFEATTSYRRGTARGPAAVLAASRQVDLLDLDFGAPWKAGIALLEDDPRVAAWNEEATRLAEPIHARGGEIGDDPGLLEALERVNAIGAELNDLVHERTWGVLAKDRLPVVLGGDHAVSFGAWRAACERRTGDLGLLHFDAHADLRGAYEGFTWSHASVLLNGLDRMTGIARALQVGIRDLCDEELVRIEEDSRLATLFDRDWARAGLEGRDRTELVRRHLDRLPEEVWVTFDVDGLDPALCPNTGTPVPGGLSWNEASLWLAELVKSGRRVVGVDLVEVAPGDERPDGEGIDEIVGARLLYRLIGAALATRE
jgi:agmatinase